MIDNWAIDDANLTPYQFRLMHHIARVGICFKSVRTLADCCNMSVGKVSETRTWLEENGFIEMVVHPQIGKMGYQVTGKYQRSPDEQVQQSVHQMNKTGSECSPHEQECSPHEPKTITIRQQSNKTNETVKDASPIEELMDYFLEESNCRVPNGDMKAGWLDPLVAIYKASNSSFDETKRRIKESIKALRDKGYTVANPGSIQNTAVSMSSKSKLEVRGI